MNRRSISTYLTTLAMVLTLATGALAVGNVGEDAADFTLNKFGGGTASLSENANKVVLLFFMGWG